MWFWSNTSLYYESLISWFSIDTYFNSKSESSRHWFNTLRSISNVINLPNDIPPDAAKSVKTVSPSPLPHRYSEPQVEDSRPTEILKRLRYPMFLFYIKTYR